MQIKSFFAILIGLSLALSCRCALPWGRQMPQPDLSALKDDVGTLPECDYFLPAVMQTLHYYTEMMQYELLPNIQNAPLETTAKPVTTKKPKTTTRRTTTTASPTTTTRRPTTTTRRTTTYTRPTTTTQRPPTTTKRTTPKPTIVWWKPPPTTQSSSTVWWKPPTTQSTTKKPTTAQQDFIYLTEINIWHPTTPRPHKPGNYAPEKPPYWTFFGIPMKPEQGYHKPGVQRPQNGISALSDPDWRDPAFVQWFFQPKPREIEPFDENELQYLDPLPKKLLQDIRQESSRLPALLDLDNVNEFRKRYDDSFYPRYRNNVPNMQHMRMKMKIQMQRQGTMLTGKKKTPPTRPYVLMLMLYDLLKRIAKEQKLHQCGGYTPELIEELYTASQQTGDFQMKYLLEKLLEKNEVTVADVVSRVNFLITDLNNETSDTFKTLNKIPPLVFLT